MGYWHATVLALSLLGMVSTTSPFDPAYNFEGCYKQIERNFFNPQYVQEAMSLHPDINQGQWVPIMNALREQGKDIPKRVQMKASRMKHNPFNRPVQQEEAMKVIFETIYEVFEKVMLDNQINNQSTIREMFNFLKYKQHLKNNKCIKEEQEEAE